VSLKSDREDMFLAAFKSRDNLGYWMGAGGDQKLRFYRVNPPRVVPRAYAPLFPVFSKVFHGN
jgi:hypothetical protein